jgi:GNAT superfamily N-acetyltransferase
MDRVTEGLHAMSITVTYLQMFSRPDRAAPPPRDGLVVVHAQRPTIGYYRYLYDAVGRDWNWMSRKQLTDAALAAIIHDPRDEVHVLHVDGVPAGFAELDRRTAGEIEVVQFGLMPEFIGQGLGRYFIHWAAERAWTYGPRRLWLHTCTEDHPAAIPNYLKAGFHVYDVQPRPASAGE